MATFSWLHFSDLHAGQKGTEERWAPIESRLHEDLQRLHRRMSCRSHGGWDAVLFTGDVAFSGSEGDYAKVDAKLEPLWKLFGKLGCDPVLIAIPGNHDAAQTTSAAAESLIGKQQLVWSAEKQEAVRKAFAAFDGWYSNWLDRHKPPKSLDLRRNGHVPGDLSACFDKDGLLVSMVGLNSSFVDIWSGEIKREGKLVLLPIQTHEVWPPEARRGPAIMLTHHPREWLRKEVNFAADIAPQTQFFLHCFGHMHEANQTNIRAAGAKPIRLAQGASLFGMERFGKGNVERIHGYSGGAIDWDGNGAARLRIWPRIARYPKGGEYYMAPNWAHFELDEEEAIAELLPEYHFPLPDEARAKERDLAAKLLRAALATDSEPVPSSSKTDVLPLINLLASKIPQNAEAGALTRQTRFAIERYLLDPDAEGVESLQRFAKDAAHPEIVQVSPKFFARVQDREVAWRCYFEVLEAVEPRPAIQTVCLVQGTAFIAAQHLLAGLLARMDEDWRKVLDVYDRVAEDKKSALGRRPNDAASAPFDRLQTAQWICWLIWGPSIPACSCDAWKGLRPLQLGYGDENFSLPVFDAPQSAGLLDGLASSLKKPGVAAVPVQFVGRLTPSLCNDPDPENKSALTQKSLFAPDSGSVAVLLEAATQTGKAGRSYFTSYQWMMFLVGKDPEKPGGPPRLLRDGSYPEFPPQTEQDIDDVRNQRLWRNLVPVFVHANLADAEVFKRQRQMLVDNAVALLHSLWRQRAELFDEAGVRFFLVAASDYTGCGSELQFPSAEPLAELLKKRLEDETDAGLKNAISVPELKPHDKAWKPVAGYFSTCGMPFMVSNYYKYVGQTGNAPGV
jgi:predicted MPP superfamily phosphohydrolase